MFDLNILIRLTLTLALVVSSEAFFLKWGAEQRQAAVPKSWVQPLQQSAAFSSYRYQYPYNPYDQRKYYQMPQVYSQEIQMPQSMAPIPISVPAGAGLTPLSLQHVQLVPCMCPVAPEEAEKLQEQVGPGPYLAQSYTPSYQVQQPAVSSENAKSATKQ